MVVRSRAARLVFVFNDTATTEIYTLSLHDALPISRTRSPDRLAEPPCGRTAGRGVYRPAERQHGAAEAELLGVATPGAVSHREVDGRGPHRPAEQPRFRR